MHYFGERKFTWNICKLLRNDSQTFSPSYPPFLTAVHAFPIFTISFASSLRIGTNQTLIIRNSIIRIFRLSGLASLVPLSRKVYVHIFPCLDH